MYSKSLDNKIYDININKGGNVESGSKLDLTGFL